MDTLDWVAQATGGTLHGQAAAFTGVTQDTRTLQAQDLYVALKGERFDGHTYVRKAACLLYTSPSPRDQRGSRMPSSA